MIIFGLNLNWTLKIFFLLLLVDSGMFVLLAVYTYTQKCTWIHAHIYTHIYLHTCTTVMVICSVYYIFCPVSHNMIVMCVQWG